MLAPAPRQAADRAKIPGGVDHAPFRQIQRERCQVCPSILRRPSAVAPMLGVGPEPDSRYQVPNPSGASASLIGCVL